MRPNRPMGDQSGALYLALGLSAKAMLYEGTSLEHLGAPSVAANCLDGGGSTPL